MLYLCCRAGKVGSCNPNCSAAPFISHSLPNKATLLWIKLSLSPPYSQPDCFFFFFFFCPWHLRHPHQNCALPAIVYLCHYLLPAYFFWPLFLTPLPSTLEWDVPAVNQTHSMSDVSPEDLTLHAPAFSIFTLLFCPSPWHSLAFSPWP